MGRSGSPSNTWYFGPTRVQIPNGISIVFHKVMRGVVGSLALNYKFTANSAGERIFNFKIGQLLKLQVRIWMGFPFMGHAAYVTYIFVY